MIGRKKQKKETLGRTPNLPQHKQSTFQYSSNRSQREGVTNRSAPKIDGETTAKGKEFTNFFTRFAKLPYILGLTVAVLIGFYLSLISGGAKVVVEGNPLLINSVSTYSAATGDAANGLTGKSKFTVNRQKIEDKLKQQFPEINDVRVSTPLFSNSLKVDIQLTNPTIVMNSGVSGYIIDDRGVAVMNLDKTSPSFDILKLIQITDQSNVSLEVGKPALTSDQVNFIDEIKHQSDAKALTLETVNLLGGGGELNIKYAGLAYSVKFNLNEDARISFGTFIATKEYLEANKQSPAEYVDVRIPERAYVK